MSVALVAHLPSTCMWMPVRVWVCVVALHNVPKSETIAGCTYIPMWIVDML